MRKFRFLVFSIALYVVTQSYAQKDHNPTDPNLSRPDGAAVVLPTSPEPTTPRGTNLRSRKPAQQQPSAQGALDPQKNIKAGLEALKPAPEIPTGYSSSGFAIDANTNPPAPQGSPSESPTAKPRYKKAGQ